MHTASFLDECMCVVLYVCARVSDCLAQAALTGLQSLNERDAVHGEHKRLLWHRRVLTQRVSIQTTPLPNEGCKCKSLSLFLSLMT